MTSDDSWTKKNSSRWKKSFIRFISFKRRTTPDNHESLNSSTFERLEKSQQEIIKSVIELPHKNAREIMTPRVDVITIDSKTTMKSLLKLISNAEHSRIPVYESTIDNIIGILYIKDIFKFITDKTRKFQLKKTLQKPLFIPETMPLDDLLLEFKKIKPHIAIIVDEYGGFSGIVTLEDIIEEIVGEIIKNFNGELQAVLKISNNVYKVDSRMTISDFNKEVDTNLPTDEFDTIGGLVYDLFGKIPKKNEIVEYNNISFKISDIKGTRIDRIIITISSNEQNQ